MGNPDDPGTFVNKTASGLTVLDLRLLMRGAYDMQKLRSMMGNRVCAQFRAKLGLRPEEPETAITDKEKQSILNKVKKEYAEITPGAAAALRRVKFKENGIISNEAELVIVAEWFDLKRAEELQFRRIKPIVEAFPLWEVWFKDIRGVGPQMAGVIMSEINIYKAEYPSSVWKYCGLDVAPDGKGRSRRKEHLVERTYKDKEGNDATRMGVTFDPYVKSKLLGVLAGSFMMSAATAKPGTFTYREIYDGYKNRIENMDEHKEKTDGHRHAMASRYMIKWFLADTYTAWRKLEGLPLAESYAQHKLGLVHGKAS